MIELDHVILFVPDPTAGDELFPGCVIDPGRRHDGQGTRNRRVLFADTFVEILWIEGAEEEQRSGLGLGPRCVPGAACPFGVVLRGPVPPDDRWRYVPYRVPGGGPALLLLAEALDDPRLPFVGVWEDAVPLHRDPALLEHPGGARGIRRAGFGGAVPDLGSVTPRDVVFDGGPARLHLDVVGVATPWGFGG